VFPVGFDQHKHPTENSLEHVHAVLNVNLEADVWLPEVFTELSHNLFDLNDASLFVEGVVVI